MHCLLVINLHLPLIWGVIEVVKVVEAKVVEVVAKRLTKGAVVVNKAIVIEDVGFVSALNVTVRIIQLNSVGSCMENPQLNIQSSLYTREYNHLLSLQSTPLGLVLLLLWLTTVLPLLVLPLRTLGSLTQALLII